MHSLSGNSLGAEGAAALAPALAANGALTELSIYGNRVGDEGVGAICEAIQSNKETKLASLNFKNNGISPVGANAVAAMVAVTGGLTVTNLLGNQLDAESAKMLAEVAKQKGISLCGIRRDQTTADFSDQDLKPPDAILLVSDLSQAGATGSLTSLNLGDNQLCGLDKYGFGTYTAEGITAIADALRVNGVLTALDLSSNKLKDGGVSAVCQAIQSNKETKLASLNFRNNEIGPVGANAVAAMVAATGSLTKMRYVRLKQT